MTDNSPLLTGHYDRITLVGNPDGTVQITATSDNPFKRAFVPAAKDVEIINGEMTFTCTAAMPADSAWSTEVEL